MTQFELKVSVMKRVHRIYVLRKFFNPMMYRLYLAAVFVVGIVSFVSVSNIAANIPIYGSFADIYDFILSAFAHTELAVQIMTIGAFLTILWFIVDVANTLAVEKTHTVSA